MKIVYSILHYNTFEVTKNCIDSLLKYGGDDSETVVVDNCSKNDSGLKLKEEYKDNDKVHFIINKEDIGFSKGNNLGYIYAKEKCRADVIVVMNNDMVITQDDFAARVGQAVSKYPDAAVIAPDIINSLGIHQNPFRLCPLGSRKILRSAIRYRIYSFCCGNGLLYKLVEKKYHDLKADTTIRKLNKEKAETGLFDIIPHGSCIIFCPKFIEESDFAFVPCTYFYGEEDLLYDYLKLKNFSSVYTDSIQISHLEKAATQTVSALERKREKFQTMNKSRSLISTYRYRRKNNIPY